jgi:hypothetical protein
LLILLGYTIFAGKNSINVNMLWLLSLQDLDRLGDWSWGGKTLAFFRFRIWTGWATGRWWLHDLAYGNIIFLFISVS